MGKTVLIGGTGFLGPIFLKNHPEIVAVGRSPLPEYLDNELIDMPDTESFDVLDDIEIDNVIFLIGSSEHKVLNSHPTLALEKNVLPLKKALTYFQERKLNKFVSFSTMLQYDSKKIVMPVDESQPLNPYVNNYVFSKVMAEEVTKMYSDRVPCINIRISNVFGPTHLERPDIVPTLMWKVLENADEPITVWNKKPKRDFVFAEDAVKAVMKLIDTDYTGSVNVGSGVSTSVGELTDIISKMSGVAIGDLDIPVSGHMEFRQDISLLKKLTDWSPETPIDEGLEKTYIKMKEFRQHLLRG